jgi:hypothetical protein
VRTYRILFQLITIALFLDQFDTVKNARNSSGSWQRMLAFLGQSSSADIYHIRLKRLQGCLVSNDPGPGIENSCSSSCSEFDGSFIAQACYWFHRTRSHHWHVNFPVMRSRQAESAARHATAN